MALARLQAVQRSLAPVGVNQFISTLQNTGDKELELLLVLPDDSPVHLHSGSHPSDGSHDTSAQQTVYINHLPALAFQQHPTKKYQHLLSAIGTKHERSGQANHVPRYPLIHLFPPVASLGSNAYPQRQDKAYLPGQTAHTLPHGPAHLPSTQHTSAHLASTHTPSYSASVSVSVSDFWGTLYALHHLHHEQEMIPLVLDAHIQNRDVLADYAIHTGLAVRPKRSPVSGNASHKHDDQAQAGGDADEDVLFFLRSAFWQGAGTTGWHARGFLQSQGRTHCPPADNFSFGETTSRTCYPPYPPYPYSPGFTRTPMSITAHPRRPPKPQAGEVVYKRWCREVGKMLSFVAVDFGQGTRDSPVPQSAPAPAALGHKSGVAIAEVGETVGEEGVGSVVGEEGKRGGYTEHVELYHRWHNSAHVKRAWKHGGSIEFHRRYLERMYRDDVWLAGGHHVPSLSPLSAAASAVADEHEEEDALIAEERAKEESNPGGGAVGLVMCWDDEPMGWAEIVWVMENHLGTYTPDGNVRPYDRGMHLLVGEKKFAGKEFSKGWYNSILHVQFLLDPRTDRILGEPAAGNEAVLRAAERGGMHVHSVVEFPYKRSALIYVTRERFFQQDLL